MWNKGGPFGDAVICQRPDHQLRVIDIILN
jgi:hypothetical protein